MPNADSAVVRRLYRCRRRAAREAEPWRAGAERHLVRRADDEPVAARRGRVRLERGSGRRDRGRRWSAFSIGSETGGSIVAPAMRCGVTGLRPTFGRVPRTGAMTLCWSLDKLGPMTRSVEDAMLVLQAITGPDAGDVVERAQSSRFRRDRAGVRPAGRLFPGVDERGTVHRRRPRGARDGRKR